MKSGRPASQGQPVTSSRGEEKRCSHCGSHHTSCGWPHHPTTSQRLCNACWQYANRHGGQLPSNDVLQRRPAKPQKMADVHREVAQRRCLQCGSASPGGGMKASWYRHPATGEGWLCKPCYRRTSDRLKRSEVRRHVAVPTVQDSADAAEEQQAGQRQQQQRRRQQQRGPERGGSEEGEQARAAPAPAPPQRKRKQQERQPPAAPAADKAPQPAAERRQRRKQAQPQHLPLQPAPQQAEQLSLAVTVRLEGAEERSVSEVPMAASPSGAPAAAGAAAAAAAAACAIHGHQAPAKQQQQAAAQLAGQPLPLPPQQEAASTLFDLLQQAMDVAAAAASGLTLELAAAFAMLRPLPDQKEALVRRLLERQQYSAAASAMQVALRAAGHLPPLVG